MSSPHFPLNSSYLKSTIPLLFLVFALKQVTLITTVLDAIEYSATKLIQLYESRWQVELDLRHLKTTLGMDVLRSKTPQMVRKELYVYLLAYNLLRTLMWSAGTTHKADPFELSLQKTRQLFDKFIPELATASTKKRDRLYLTLLAAIVHKPVPLRPGRSEPRVQKRRPKAYPWMHESRQVLRQKCCSA